MSNYKAEIKPSYEKGLGKIKSIKLGTGGYQDAMFGLSVGIESGSLGMGDFISAWWENSIECDQYTKWKESDRVAAKIKLVDTMQEILKDAKVDSIDKLVGKPVEYHCDGFDFKSWRILTEVL